MLIAEIGNNHFGNFETAKLLIRAAKDNGADLVKSQAFMHWDMMAGSMPTKFYAECQFTYEHYVELIYYAREVVGIELFYSIFSTELMPLMTHQKYHKISSGQTMKRRPKDLYQMDAPNVFISVPGVISNMPKLERATVLYASPYCGDGTLTYEHLKQIDYITLSGKLKSNVGYSDHNPTVNACLNAISHYGARTIEKHFTLRNNQKWCGIEFRDTVHGVTPDQFRIIAKELQK